MESDKKSLIRSFFLPFAFVTALWAVKLTEQLVPVDLSGYGLLPRTLTGLAGILFYPFLHGDFKHLISNSVPLLVLGPMLLYFYRQIAIRVFFWIYLLSGFWLWLGGRESYHIGASGLVYGLTAFLFVSGIIRRHTGLMALSLVVVFLYGGLIWGIFPLYKMISWEGHLFGLLAGVIMAFAYRRQGPQRKKYEWEEEEEEDDIPEGYYDPGYYEDQGEDYHGNDEEEHQDPLLRYIYKRKKGDDKS